MTIFNKLILVSIVIAAFPLAAQSTFVPSSTKPETPQTAKPAILSETVLASNASVKVTKADFDAEMSRIPESEHFEFLTSRTRIASLLENILINRVLAKEAIEQKIDQNQKVKDEILNQTEKILAKYRGQQLLREIKVKDFTAAAREAYIVDTQKSLRPARYKLWQALVTFVGRDKETARKRATEARERVERGDDLTEIAKEFSDDVGSKRSGGVIDFTQLKDFEAPFADALKKMKPGDVSYIVETRYGFHVIYLMELMPEKKLSFEEMKPELLEEARIAYLKSSYDHHLDAIRLDPSLKIDAEALDTMRPRIPDNVKPVYTPPEIIKAPPRKASKP
jgi:peptidyl-prolyl cis-trans isomerase C